MKTTIQRPLSQSGKPLDPQQQLLAAVQALTKAIQGASVANPQDTATPPSAPLSQQATFVYRTITIAGGATFTDYFVGNFFYLYSNTNANASSNFQVSFNNQATNACPVGFQFSSAFSQVNFKNNDLNSATIVYFVGNGQIDFHAQTLTGTVTTQGAQANTGTYAAEVAMGAAQSIFAANTKCYAIYLCADPNNNHTVYIGFDNTVAANKFVIALTPGEIYVMNNYNGNLFAFGTAGDNLAVSYA